MKKTILTFIVELMMMFSLGSCGTVVYATTQDDIYVETVTYVVRSTADYNIVIRYGTPYYYNGSLLYYLYNDLYYYPFYYDNYWYMRAYRRPFNHLHYRPYFRPHRYDYRFDREYRPHHNWYHPHAGHNHKSHKPDIGNHRNDRYVKQNIPSQPNRGGNLNRCRNRPRGGNFGGVR